jgi:hypothetical protein
MSTRLLLDGQDLRALMLRVRDEMGPDATIVRAERIRTGGIAGFFAREHYELTVEVPDRPRRKALHSRPAPPDDATRPSGQTAEPVGLDALLAAADAVESAPQVSTDGDAFAEVLASVQAITGGPARPAGAPTDGAPDAQDVDDDAPVPPPPGAAGGTGGPGGLLGTAGLGAAGVAGAYGTLPPPPAAFTPAPPDALAGAEPATWLPAPAPPRAEPERVVFLPAAEPQPEGAPEETPAPGPTDPAGPVRPGEPEPADDLDDELDRPPSVAALLELGVPTRLLAGFDDPHAEVPLSRLVRTFDRPRTVRLTPGSLVVVAGPPDLAVRTAVDMAHRAGLATEDVVLAGDVDALPGHGRRVQSAQAAARVRGRTPDDAPTVVALGVGGHLAGAIAGAELLTAFRPDEAWAAVDARLRSVELRRWLRAVGRERPFDAVAALHVFEAQAPGSVLNLGVPVGWVDGLPASPVVWAAVLSERLSDDARWD